MNVLFLLTNDTKNKIHIITIRTSKNNNLLSLESKLR